jgi:hypothetical protein
VGGGGHSTKNDDLNKNKTNLEPLSIISCRVSVRFDDLLGNDANNATELLASIEESIQPDDACNVQFTSVNYIQELATLIRGF